MELSGFYSAAHAETTGEEEAVDLGALDSSKPRWNPYQFDRAPALIAVPALILLIVVLHLFRRRRRQPLNPSRAEEYFND